MLPFHLIHRWYITSEYLVNGVLHIVEFCLNRDLFLLTDFYSLTCFVFLTCMKKKWKKLFWFNHFQYFQTICSTNQKLLEIIWRRINKFDIICEIIDWRMIQALPMFGWCQTDFRLDSISWEIPTEYVVASIQHYQINRVELCVEWELWFNCKYKLIIQWN